AALSPEVRPPGRHEGRRAFAKQLAELRNSVSEASGTEVPPLQELHRVSGSSLLMAVGTLIGLVALFSQVGTPADLWDTITRANPAWLATAFGIGLLSSVAYALALMGTVPINLPLVRTTELQVSTSFANLAVPGVGGTASQIRFLQKQGLDLAQAVSSGGLLATLSSIIVQVFWLVIALELTPTKYNTARIDTGKLADVGLIAVLVIAVVIGLVLGVPRLRRAVATPAKSAATTVWAAVRSPRCVALMLIGNSLATLMSAAVYMACIVAFGASVNFWALLSLNIVIGSIASLVPIPGGGAAVSSVGMSGALAAAGVPIETAVAAALINQLVVSYLPAIPGWFATQDLLRADYL